ncbi:MAG: ABC transporter ATP-binding protein/permease [Rickettsiales bacterium]|jgi:ATP-binding cassette subfamily B protein|nr:ABC transporter ATP-binding protein/permease [Rickettsiales bacterium]
MDFPKTLSQFYWSIIKKFPACFIGMFFIVVIAKVLDYAAEPLINKWVFAIFENTVNSDFAQIADLLILIAVVYGTGFVLDIIQSVVEGRVRPVIFRTADKSLYNRIYNNDTEFFINRAAGQIANKLSEIRNNLFPLTLDFWTKIISIALGFIFISGMLFQMSPLLAALVVGNGVFRIAWQMWRQRHINKLSKEIVDVSSGISGMRTDSLGNAITAKLFANTAYENNYIWKKQQKEIQLRQKNAFFQRVRWIPSSTVWYIVSISLVFVCWFLISDGQMGISDAAFAVTSFSVMNGMFMRLANSIQDYSENRTKARHAYADVILEQSVADRPGARALKITRAEIDFEKVSFDYGNQDVIKNFDLNVAHGEKVGVVGLSGAGKTTLVNLILRLYDVKGGAIKIDGQDLRDVKQDSLRAQIAFVPQESVLFNRSLLENIRYAKPNASKKQVIDAAKKANIHEFIDQQPKKYDTLVGNRGIKLSGGQRQRIAIARAILKDSPILILDEATSALDSKNEGLIQSALQKIMKGKTTIAIAHRLSTLRNMNRIVVMDRGRIVESGTHAQLLRRGGLYKKLWDMQTNGFIS